MTEMRVTRFQKWPNFDVWKRQVAEEYFKQTGFIMVLTRRELLVLEGMYSIQVTPEEAAIRYHKDEK